MATSDIISRTQGFYTQKPDAGILQIEFGFYSLEAWREQGHITESTDLNELFGYEKLGISSIGNLGWVEASLYPCFETIVLEDRGDHELVQDYAGRHVLYFKNRRSGFMPEYVDHPVKDMKTWEEQVKWRMNPETASRYDGFDEHSMDVRKAQLEGYHVQQNCIGGYMYLRSIMGPCELLYHLYDQPELVHDCMQTWFKLADTVIARRQQYVNIDELFLAEDICYKTGSLISPDMMKEFLFPYYQQLIANIKARNMDKGKRFYLQIDTDGDCRSVIDLYLELGMDYMSPFEVAANCDVVAIGKQYPDLLIKGGIDKRILASGREAIDREVERILPVMKKRGGYMPCCDHGVPAEVPFEDYVYYRKRISEYR